MNDRLLTVLKESWLALEQELDELLVHGDVKQSTNVISYRQHLWVLPEEVPAETANQIAMFLLPDTYNTDTMPFDNDEDSSNVNIHDITSLVTDADRSDILMGWLRNGELVLNSGAGFKLDPKSSLLVKKVANTLKVKKVTYQDDMDGNSNVSVPRKKLTADVANIAYHGTAIKYLEGILKQGLAPMGHQTNYEKQGIYHDDKIFFATRFGEAGHHATHTGRVTNSQAIVLEFMIPDKNLVISDYDVDMHGGNTTYDAPHHKTHTKYGSDKSFALSKEFGVYGYKGKILPQHIKYVYVLFNQNTYDASIKDYKKFSPGRLKKFLDRVGSFDEFQYYIK